jgi:hypothetical protein
VGDHTGFSRAAEAAHKLVKLKSMNLAESSQNTYASGLHRFIDFGTKVAKSSMEEILPPSRGDQVPTKMVELFIARASEKYKPSTIQVTLNALTEWHKSKGVPDTTVRNESISKLMAAVKTSQGQAGQPQGKQGMSKSLLRVPLSPP